MFTLIAIVVVVFLVAVFVEYIKSFSRVHYTVSKTDKYGVTSVFKTGIDSEKNVKWVIKELASKPEFTVTYRKVR